MRSLVTTVICACLSINAFGRSSNLQVLPSAQVFPTPTGILFPAFTAAAGTNPAAIPLSGKNSAVQASYTSAGIPQLHEGFASVATSSKNFGINAGYLGTFFNGSSTHGTFAGAGAFIEPVALGIGFRDFNMSDSASGAVDLGLIAGQGKGLTFGFVMYNANGSSQLNAGVGFGGGKKYNMEFNLLLPPFNSAGSSYYLMTFQGNLSPGDTFNFHFRTTYYSGYATYEHTLGVAIWLKENWNIFGQFTNPRVWTGGLTLAF